MSKYKVHDHGKVTFVWDEDDHCEALGHWYSYERLGLYYRTRNGPVPFCDLHFWWITDTIVFQSGAAAYYTAPGDSALSTDTTRNKMDVLAWTGKDEGIAYDAAGRPVMDPQQGYTDKLDMLNGGYLTYFGDPRPDAELRRQAKTIQGGMKRLAGRIRHSRNVEFWLLGPVSVIAGQQLYGSIVAKVHGRFEEGMGFQPCTLWQSPYAQDGSFDDAFGVYHEGKLQWNWEGTCSEEVKKIRSNLSPLPLPASARGVLWKLEQYANRRSMCQAKAMSG